MLILSSYLACFMRSYYTSHKNNCRAKLPCLLYAIVLYFPQKQLPGKTTLLALCDRIILPTKTTAGQNYLACFMRSYYTSYKNNCRAKLPCLLYAIVLYFPQKQLPGKTTLLALCDRIILPTKTTAGQNYLACFMRSYYTSHKNNCRAKLPCLLYAIELYFPQKQLPRKTEIALSYHGIYFRAIIFVATIILQVIIGVN